MKARRVELVHGRDKLPLVVRARFETTFFGIGTFLAVVLLFTGGYLLAETFLNPLGASDMGLIAAGFVLALSSFLLVYLVRPRAKLELGRREQAVKDAEALPGSRLTVYGETVQKHIAAQQTLGKAKTLPGPM